MRDSPALSSRILAFQLHAGCSGQCVLDGFGLAPEGWKISRRATRTEQSLRAFLTGAVERFRPSAIVLGVSRRMTAIDAALRFHALSLLRSFGIPIVFRSVRTAYALLRGRVRGVRREDLARTIAQCFLPDLERVLTPAHARDHRSAWHALAVALVELVRRFPRAAFALATPRAFSNRPLHAALRKAEAVRYPNPV